MPYKIIDRQGTGHMESEVFETKEEVRKRLISFHEIDWNWSGEYDIGDTTLEDVLNYGEWDIEEIK